MVFILYRDCYFLRNNIHAKISACSLAENTSINPKQCRKLKLSAKSWNWVQKVEIKLIDKTVAKAQQNKMAGRLRNNNVLIQSLKENTLNKTPNKAQIAGSKSGSLGLLKRAVTKVWKSTNRRLNKFLENRVLSLPTPSNMLETSVSSRKQLHSVGY